MSPAPTPHDVIFFASPDELRAEGFTVLPGPPPEEQRGGREVIETLNVGITILDVARRDTSKGSLATNLRAAVYASAAFLNSAV